jgi:hypothetical protein
MRAVTTGRSFAISFAACICLVLPTVAQQPDPAPAAPIPALAATEGAVPLASSVPATTRSLPEVPGARSVAIDVPLTLHDRFVLETKTTFGPSAFAVPAAEAAVTMADPPSQFPREWKDGGGAFGRIYGADFARHTTAGVTHFGVAAIVREDPRYAPSASTNLGVRFFHAVAFTIVDRSDSGRRTLAASNLAGSLAGGFVGMAFYPDGFNDSTHALQRSLLELGNFGGHNLIAEFSPEMVRVLHKFHFPDRMADSFLPADRKQIQP